MGQFRQRSEWWYTGFHVLGQLMTSADFLYRPNDGKVELAQYIILSFIQHKIGKMSKLFFMRWANWLPMSVIYIGQMMEKCNWPNTLFGPLSRKRWEKMGNINISSNLSTAVLLFLKLVQDTVSAGILKVLTHEHFFRHFSARRASFRWS